MRLTVRDGLATVFVAAASAVYLLWVTGTAMTGCLVRGDGGGGVRSGVGRLRY